MKKIVIITHNLYGGGCERVISELVNWISDRGINCTIVTEYESDPFYKINKEVEIIPLMKKKQIGYFEIFHAYSRFRRLMKNLKPDIILAMPEKVNVWTVISMIGTGIPVVVSERNDPYRYPANKTKRFLRDITYPTFASGFIFQTDNAKGFFKPNIQKRSVVLPNPLNPERIPEIWSGKRRKEVVSIGRLDKQKNYKLLVDSFYELWRIHPDYKLTIYGEGPLREELNIYARELLPKDTFDFPGKFQDVLTKIRDSSIFVLSSNYEGMPNVLIEAMALGLPVISTDCPIGGPAALIRNQYNGLLTKVGDVESLSNAMLKIANDKKFADEIGRNALNIREELEINKVALDWLNYLDSICNKNNP